MIFDVFSSNNVISGTVPQSGAITGQAARPVAGTPVVSTNAIDLVQARDIGEGGDLYVCFTIVSAYNTLTSLEMEVIVADDDALTTNPTAVGSSGRILLADGLSTANSQFYVRINPAALKPSAFGGALGRRYLGARYHTTGSTPTTGSICAYLTMDIQDGRKFYASGFAVQ
jgi:hypothetical protein